ncbi:MAG: hypothetical protein IJT59_07090 [Desulfovibrionaceae bacterium]|nr:hypothetical protein [Desulfovibrionaceae bacterium]
MDDAFYVMTEFIQPITFIFVTMIGWGVKAIWSKVCDFDKKIDDLRAEIHAELQEYERKETCRAHREAIMDRIDHIAKVHGICLTKSGMAVVDINNVKQMNDLHNYLSPEQRKEHANKCQFKEDME